MNSMERVASFIEHLKRTSDQAAEHEARAQAFDEAALIAEHNDKDQAVEALKYRAVLARQARASLLFDRRASGARLDAVLSSDHGEQ